jgi:hypothetical protein
LCTHWLRSRTPSPHLGSYTRALLVSQDRRHLFVTPLTHYLLVVHMGKWLHCHFNYYNPTPSSSTLTLAPSADAHTVTGNDNLFFLCTLVSTSCKDEHSLWVRLLHVQITNRPNTNYLVTQKTCKKKRFCGIYELIASVALYRTVFSQDSSQPLSPEGCIAATVSIWECSEKFRQSHQI